MLQAITYTNGSDVIAAAKEIRSRLWKPRKVVFDTAPARVVVPMHVDFVNSNHVITDYRGHVPKFVNAAKAKAKQRATQEAKEAEQAKRNAEMEAHAKLRSEASAALEAEAERVQAEREQEAQAQREQLELLIDNQMPPLDVQIKILCLKYGFEYRDIIGKYAGKAIASARKTIIQIIASNNPKVSMTKIGKEFGGRDHSTIAFALQGVGITGRVVYRPRTPAPKQEKTGTSGILRMSNGTFRARVYHGNRTFECGRHETVQDAKRGQEIQMKAVLSGVPLPHKLILQMVRSERVAA